MFRKNAPRKIVKGSGKNIEDSTENYVIEWKYYGGKSQERKHTLAIKQTVVVTFDNKNTENNMLKEEILQTKRKI